MPRFSTGLLTGVLLAVCAPAFAAEPATLSAQDWLVKMSEAAKSASYQGTVVYRGDEMLETFRVTHRFHNGVERERVQSLTGEPREVEKQGGNTTCLLPKARRMTVNQQPTPKGLFPGLTRERVAQIAQIYEFDDLGTQRVAGRNCRGIAVTPRDAFRYGYEIWADEQTGVPLKVNMIGREGVTLEQMMFTEVELPANIPDAAFAGEEQIAAPSAPVPPAALSGAEDMALARLPPGFRVTRRELRPLPNGRGMVEHILLSDGLSAVSVFSARRAAPKSFQGISQMGAMHAYGRVTGSFHITVVGEAPEETVKMIGDGAQPAAETPKP